MKPKARVKITLACNKNCKYCINKNKDYRDKWQEIKSVYEITWSNYRSVVVSGGEPTMSMDLINILRGIRISTKAPIYLQTNGTLLTKQLVKEIDNLIDGIGLSIHELHEFDHLYNRFLDILKIKPIRLYIEEEKFDEFLIAKWEKDGFKIREWFDGEFDGNEKIFILKEKENDIRTNI